jgi:hypothetical protein
MSALIHLSFQKCKKFLKVPERKVHASNFGPARLLGCEFLNEKLVGDMDVNADVIK